jgi:predicted outer membrane repeat protein
MYIDSTPVYCSTNDFYHVPTIKNCIIENNTATNLGGGGSGGGIYDVESDTEIENCRFKGNTSNAGGAIHHNYSSITIDKCVFQGNQAVSSGWCGGGAIYGLNHNTTTGGLIFITNCLFHENSSDSNGGAICNNQVDPQIWNSTFYGNTAAAGYSGGAYFGFNLSDGPYVYNSIFWENTPNQLQINDPRYYVGHSNVQGGWTGSGGDNIDDNPSFVDPDTGDFHLSIGSPCIDTGRYFGAALPDDLDGVLRPHDGDGDGTAKWDMGAYEFTHITLIGDLNWDWDIDGRDLRDFGSVFGSRIGDSGYNASLDFDADGRIDKNDLEIFADGFGQIDNS